MDTNPTYRLWLIYLPEALGLAALGVLIGLTYQGSRTLPRLIPTHFIANGTPNAWGPKSMFFLPLAVGVGMYLLLSSCQLLSNRRKYGHRVTEAGLQRLDALTRGMLRWTKMELLALFIFLQWTTIQVATHAAARLSPVGMIGMIALLIGTSLVFTAWILQVLASCRA